MDTLNLKSPGANGTENVSSSEAFSRAGGPQMHQQQMQPSTPRPSVSSGTAFQSQQSKQPPASSFGTGSSGGGSFPINSNGLTQQNENGGGYSTENQSAGGDQNSNGSGMNPLGAGNLSLLSLPTVLHFIQSEWARFDMERNQWEALQAEMEARIALLQGERTSLDKLKNDLVRRIKMLECALRQERLKNVRLLKQADMLKNTSGGNTAITDAADGSNSTVADNGQDFQALRMGENVRLSKLPTPSTAISVLIQHQQQQQQQNQANGVNTGAMSGGGVTNAPMATDNKGWDFKEGRWAIQQYLKELNYTDNIINIRTARLKSLCGGTDGVLQPNNSPVNGQQQQQPARFFNNDIQNQQQQQQQSRDDITQAMDSLSMTNNKNNSTNQRQSQHSSSVRADSNSNNTDETDNDAETSAALREFEFLSDNDNTDATRQQPEANAVNGIAAGGGWGPIDAQRLDHMKNEYIQHRLAQHHQQQGAMAGKQKHGFQGNRRETLVNRAAITGGSSTTTSTEEFDRNAEEADSDCSSLDAANNTVTGTSALQQAFKISIGHVNDNSSTQLSTSANNKSNTSFGNVDQSSFNNNNNNNNNNSMQHDGFSNKPTSSASESSLLSPISPNPADSLSGSGGGVAGGGLIAVDMEDDDDNDGTDNVFDMADGSSPMNELGFRSGGLHGRRSYAAGNAKRGGGGGRHSDVGGSSTASGTGAAAERRVKWRGLYALSDHVDVCRVVCFHPNDLSFASCSDDCTVKLWTLWASNAGSSIDATITPNSRKNLVPYTTLADARELQMANKLSADEGAKSDSSPSSSSPMMGTSGLLALMPDRHADFGPHVTLKLHRYPVIACTYACSSTTSLLPTDADISAAAVDDDNNNNNQYNLLFTADISGNIRAWNLDRLMPPQAAFVQKDGASNDNVVNLQHVQAAEMPEIHTDAVWTLLYVPPVSGTTAESAPRRNFLHAKLISVDCQSQLVIWTIRSSGPVPNQTVSIEVLKQYNIRESIHAVDANGIAAAAANAVTDNDNSDAELAALAGGVAVETDVNLSTVQQHQLLLTDELVGVVVADERCEEILACFRSSGCYIINTQSGKLVRQLKLTYGESGNSNSDAGIDHNWDILSCASHAPSQLAVLGHRNGKVTAVFLGNTGEIATHSDNGTAASSSAPPPTSPIVRAQWQAQLQDVVALAFDRNGERLLTGASDGAIRLWSTIRWHCIQDVKESRPKFNEAVTTVCVHAQQPMLASGSADGVVRIYTPY